MDFRRNIWCNRDETEMQQCDDIGTACELANDESMSGSDSAAQVRREPRRLSPRGRGASEEREHRQNAHREKILHHPPKDDAEGQARLKMRKEQSGQSQRDDIQTFVDYIDADEKRL